MTVEEYLAKLPDWQRDLVNKLIPCVMSAVPEANLAIKWSQPVFTTNGPFCFIKPAREHLNFGFWWGAKVADPDGMLEGAGDKMRHIKIRESDEIDCAKLRPLIVDANRLNHDLGDPTKTKA